MPASRMFNVIDYPQSSEKASKRLNLNNTVQAERSAVIE